MNATEKKGMPIVVPVPDRIRKIDGSFAWLDHRLRRDGHLERLTREDICLYVFLVLAADRDGVSYYRKEKMCQALGVSWEQFEIARERLIERNYIAFASYRPGDINGYHQVLPLPERPHA